MLATVLFIMAMGVCGLYAGNGIFAIGVALRHPGLMTMAVNRVSEQERASVVGSFTVFLDIGKGGGGLLNGSWRVRWRLTSEFCALVGLAMLRLAMARKIRALSAELQAHVAADL